MKLVNLIEERVEALKVRDIAPILGVSIQQIYKMAAKGQIPSFRVANAVRFDPQELASWLNVAITMPGTTFQRSIRTDRRVGWEQAITSA